VVRDRCLYCGAALPGGAAAPSPLERRAAEAGQGPTGPATPRVLLVVDLASASPEAVADALGLAPYEAALRARRGGLQLVGIFDDAAAEPERARLLAAGLDSLSLPESEVRIQPLPATAAEREGETLRLRAGDDELTLGGEDLLIVVHGPIARQYRTAYRPRRPGPPRLDEGFRVHLHRRRERRPVEIDPANVEFGFAPRGSPRLEIEDWLAGLAPSVPRDDGFRWLPPALGVAEPGPKTALSAMGRLTRAGRPEEALESGEPVVLDNVAQFRFYSGWRAAIERRRRGAPD